MTQVSLAGSRSRWRDPVWFALGTLTRFPVAAPSRIDAAVTGRGLALGPVVGVAIGLVSALPIALGPTDPFGRLLSAILAVALAAYCTRAIHWDGLADFADGLGSRTTPERALAVMRRSDIGPFGVLTLVLTVGVQVVGLARLPAGWPAAAGWVLVLAAGRAAIAIGASSAARSAREEGLGSAVVGSVTPPLLLLVAAQMTILGFAAVKLVGLSAMSVLLLLPIATVSIALATLMTARRRIGGTTGDVLGATAELSTAAGLLVLAWS